jgi:hypothetical protein
MAGILGKVLVWAALAALARDGYLVWQGGPWRLAAAGEVWYALSPATLDLSQAVVQRYLWPGLWNPGIVTVLLWPAALVLGVPGLALLAFRRR